MPAVAVTFPHSLTLQRAYQAFWTLVVKLTRHQARPISLSDVAVMVNRDGSAKVETASALVIAGVSARPMKRRDADYDVYLQFQQRVRALQPEMGAATHFEAEVSTVRLLYLQHRIRDHIRAELAEDVAAAVVHQGFHFDVTRDAHHPVFHAQVDHECIGGAVIGRRYAARVPRCDTPRIPTAPLDLAGVVYMILQDHFPEAVERGWSEQLRGAVAQLPRLPLEDFGRGLAPDARMECPWWYPKHL